MGVILIGNTSGAGVDADGDQRLLVSTRPPSYGTSGSFRVSVPTGLVAATLASASPLFSFRWTDATHTAILEYIDVSVSISAAITTAVPLSLEAIVARSFTVSDSAGTAVTLTGSNQKDRTSVATSLVGDMRAAATATLTAGTRTLDGTGFGGVHFGTGTAVGTTALGKTRIYGYDGAAAHPIIMVQNEGFVIRTQDTGPATGSFKVRFDIGWIELLSTNFKP